MGHGHVGRVNTMNRGGTMDVLMVAVDGYDMGAMDYGRPRRATG
jgi:hypothetical protein